MILDAEAPDVGHRHRLVKKKTKKKIKEMFENGYVSGASMCAFFRNPPPATVGEEPTESAPYNIKNIEEG